MGPTHDAKEKQKHVVLGSDGQGEARAYIETAPVVESQRPTLEMERVHVTDPRHMKTLRVRRVDVSAQASSREAIPPGDLSRLDIKDDASSAHPPRETPPADPQNDPENLAHARGIPKTVRMPSAATDVANIAERHRAHDQRGRLTRRSKHIGTYVLAVLGLLIVLGVLAMRIFVGDAEASTAFWPAPVDAFTGGHPDPEIRSAGHPPRYRWHPHGLSRESTPAHPPKAHPPLPAAASAPASAATRDNGVRSHRVFGVEE